ncbi:MAG: transporter binding lipoprotein [Phycisphaerales bacterium]|nr:transporter binding lipoprotein [Phycisphaerales bacterium]
MVVTPSTRTVPPNGLRLAAVVMLGALSVGLGCKPAATAGGSTSQPSGAALKINGSTTVNLPAAEAAETLRAERGMNIQVDTQGGSSGGISMLADGLVQIGMASKHVSDDDRAKYPGVQFNEVHVGEDAVALIVSKDVWDGGVRAITKQQAKDVYESKVTNWKQLGGPDARVAFFNKEPGRGTWEVFVHWAYGGPKAAPAVSFPEVGGNEETRNKVAGTRGALSQLSSSWADGKTVFALALRTDDGQVVEPTNENIATKRYPMSRPLFLLTNGPPAGDAKTFVDYMLSGDGQKLVRKHGYLSLDQLKVKE